MKPYAVFTVVQNESLFLRIWSNYYCKMSPDVDVFVLDDSSSDGSLEEMRSRFPAVNVQSIEPGRRYDLVRLRKSVQSFQQSLLEKYEVVVYTDVDEFLLTAGPEGFATFLEQFRASSRPQARASGWHCVHAAGEEPIRLVEGKSVLEGRKSMWRLPRYDKVLVSKVVSSWTNGFHGCVGAENLKPDPDLILLHAWMIDRDSFLVKERTYAGPSVQHFATVHGLGGRPPGMGVDMPDHWRPLLHW